MSYADGYFLAHGNRSGVLIGGSAMPVVGRVCANIMTIDPTDLPAVNIDDQVVLIGRQGTSTMTAGEIASDAGPINHGILSRIAPHIPRFFV